MRIGNVEVERGVLLAPMEDVTDAPFRRICRRLGADIVYTEFISSDGLIRDARRSLEKLTLYPDERPVAIQIFGGDIPTMREAGQRAAAAKPDFIDINCGCWVKNVVARNAGAALLRQPDTMVAMAKALVETNTLPVTVKTRLGWDKDSIIIVDLAKRLEQEAGIAALCIHCRTREMGHNGSADWNWVAKVKEVVNIPIILNGDIQTPADAKRAFEQTGCDAVMVGRAAITNPFIFRQIHTYLQTGTEEEAPSIAERFDVCLEHLGLSVEFKGPKYGIIEFRKYYSGYLRGLPHASAARRVLVTLNDIDLIQQELFQYREKLEQGLYSSDETSLSEESFPESEEIACSC